MNIKTLFFGISTDLVGANSLEMELSENATVGSFKNQLQQEHPQLTQLNSYAIAVNENYASDDAKLKENDVVAIIPPVSGG